MRSYGDSTSYSVERMHSLLALRFVSILLPLLPVFWLTGTILPVFLLASALWLLWYRMPLKEGWLLLVLIIWLVGRAWFFGMSGESTGRFMASVYNSMNWFIGLSFFLMGRCLLQGIVEDTPLRQLFLRRMTVLIWVIIVWYIFFTLFGHATGKQELVFRVPGLAPIFDNAPKAIQNMFTLNIIAYDWFLGRPAYRANFLGSAHVAGGFICLTLIVIFYIVRMLSGAQRSLLSWIGIFSILLGSLSRALMATCFVAGGFALTWFQKRGSRLQLQVSFITGMLILLCIPVLFFVWDDIVNFMVSSRQGSSDDRMKIYTLGFIYTWGSHPFIGLGNKPMVEGFEYPIGSHSTLMSLFVKGGLVAFGIFMCFMMVTLGRWWHVILQGFGSHGEKTTTDIKITRFFFVYTFMFVGFFLTSDIDAEPATAAVSFLTLLLLVSWFDYLKSGKQYG